MARISRRDLIEPAEVGVYHCVQRAVRRARLCGQDPVTGKNFDHRKVWIQERLANSRRSVLTARTVQMDREGILNPSGGRCYATTVESAADER